MDGRTNGWTDGQSILYTGRMDGRMDGWMDGWMEEQSILYTGWMDGWMDDGWMDGWMDECYSIVAVFNSLF